MGKADKADKADKVGNVGNVGKVGKVGKGGNVALRSIGNAKVRDGGLPQGNEDPSVRRYTAVCSVIYVVSVNVCKVCKTSK